VRQDHLEPLSEEAPADGLPPSGFFKGAAAIQRKDTPREAVVGRRYMELPLTRLMKLTVRMLPLSVAGRAHCVWSTKGLPCKESLSLWSHEPKRDFWAPNKQRFCVGHYGSPSLERNPGGLCLLELEDVVPWQLMRMWQIDAALASNAPHPEWYHLEWHKDSAERPIYAWKPMPPSEDFVALGMLFTTTPEQPPLVAMRCVHKSWVVEATAEPQCIWKDLGMGGKAGSVWCVSDTLASLGEADEAGRQRGLAWATKGYERPRGPFYRLRDTAFSLAEVKQGSAGGPASSSPPPPGEAAAEAVGEAGEAREAREAREAWEAREAAAHEPPEESLGLDARMAAEEGRMEEVARGCAPSLPPERELARFGKAV